MPSGQAKQDAYDKGMRADAEGIKQHGTDGPDAWRVRMVMGTEAGEPRIYQEEYAPAVRGNIVEFDENDKPRLMVPVPVSARMAPGGSVKFGAISLRRTCARSGGRTRNFTLLLIGDIGTNRTAGR